MWKWTMAVVAAACIVVSAVVAEDEVPSIAIELVLPGALADNESRYQVVHVTFEYMNAEGMPTSTSRHTAYLSGQRQYRFPCDFQPQGGLLSRVTVLILSVSPGEGGILPQHKILIGTVDDVILRETPIRIELRSVVFSDEPSVQQSIVEWFESSDLNGDGRTYITEVLEYTERTLRVAFSLIDVDHNGTLCAAEFHTWFDAYLFFLRDINHDHRLSFGEFIAFLPRVLEPDFSIPLVWSGWGSISLPNDVFPSTGFFDFDRYTETAQQDFGIPPLTNANLRASRVEHADADRNGNITLAEFVTFVKQDFTLPLCNDKDLNNDNLLSHAEIGECRQPLAIIPPLVEGRGVRSGYTFPRGPILVTWDGRITYERLIIRDDTVLAFVNVGGVRIDAKELRVGKHVSILLQGLQATTPAQPNGGKAPDLSMRLVFTRESEVFSVLSKGGDGAPGKAGARGADQWGGGVNGDPGGDGGNGGNGGAIEIHCAFRGERKDIQPTSTGGSKGEGGDGGLGGVDTAPWGGTTRAPSGSKGSAGSQGNPGSVTVRSDYSPEELLRTFDY